MGKLKLKIKEKSGKVSKVKLVENTKSNFDQVKDMVIAMHKMNENIQVARAKLKELEQPLKELELKAIDLLESDYSDGTKVTVIEGTKVIEFSAKSQSMVVDNKNKAFKALEKVKKGLALEIASVPITPLKQYVDAKALKKFTSMKSGNRRVIYK